MLERQSACIAGARCGMTEKFMNLAVWASVTEWEKIVYGLGWSFFCIGAIVAGIALIVLGRKAE
jgi:hypothetical protein